MLELCDNGLVVRRVYLSADTLTGDHVDALGHRFPEIDTAVVHLGGTRVPFHTMTMDDEQGVDFLTRIAPREALPVHHSDYGVFRSPLSAFLTRADDRGLGARISTVEAGETLPLVPSARSG